MEIVDANTLALIEQIKETGGWITLAIFVAGLLSH